MESNQIEKWLRSWARSTSMVPGSLPMRQPDGNCVKSGLHAVGLHQEGQEILILLRLQKNQSVLSKFITLTEQVTSLNQEIAQQKSVTSQLQLKRKQLAKQQGRDRYLLNY